MAEFITQLEHLGVISISGDDRVSYLQGQVTNDIQQLTEQQASLGCHCDFKGKTWNIFYTLEWQNQIHLVCNQGAMEGALPELKKYAVFAKADIADNSSNLALIGGTGKALQKCIEQFFGGLPEQHLATLSNDNGVVMALEGKQSRWLVMLKSDSVKTFLGEQSLSNQANDEWQWMDIQAGLPHISPQTSNQFVPQMLNMQSLGAISFTKGCYMGQEVVARTKYLGKNKRASFILKSETSINLKPGDLLETQVGENWRRGGTVLSCAKVNNQTWLLAVLANDTETGSVLRSKEQQTALFEVQPLPYSIDN